MEQKVSYKSTVFACYLGSICMAVVVNLPPVLFIPLREQFALSYTQLGFLVLVNFITQVSFDIVFSFLVDKYGFRRFLVASPVLTILGFILFALAPELSENPFPLFLAGTVIFSGSCGLLELLLSPIVNAIPTDEKAAAMSALHSFYCWGQILVVLLTTLFLHLFGKGAWQLIMLLWMLIPLVDFFLFLRVPLAPPVPETLRQGPRDLQGKGIFMLFVLAILFGGASELAMSQWSSAFAEKALGVSKVVGDVSGMCLFALCMGIVRALHGIPKGRLSLQRFPVQKLVMLGFAFSVVCYFVAALSGNAVIGLIACAATGLGVALLWPGTLSSAAERFPLAGAWMFAILAAGGDIGGSFSPWLVGKIADNAANSAFAKAQMATLSITPEQYGLKAGLLVSTVYPILGLAVTAAIYWANKKRLTPRETDS